MNVGPVTTLLGPVCRVQGLTVGYRVDGTWLRAVREVSFEVAASEVLAVVGETGSGKSSAALALIGMLPPNGRILTGSIMIGGRDVLRLSEAEMRNLRGREVGWVPQQPMSAFNPTMTVGRQVAEPLVIHERLPLKRALLRAREVLAETGIDEVNRVLDAYPHQLSGGMLQRAMIAMATICRPRLLIADEPTSALDVGTQRQILKLLESLRARQGLAMLMISHDLGMVSHVADRLLILYAGRRVEVGPKGQLLDQPRHPYTVGLLRSMILGGLAHKARLPSLPGYPPSAAEVEEEIGCPFRPRCERALAACASAFPEPDGHGGHLWACYNPESEAAR